MKKMSEICWEAANEHLWDGVDGSPRNDWLFSCCAVNAAANDGRGDLYAETVGVDPNRNAFDDRDLQKTQGARYMLLLFASYYFEDIGQ